MGSHHWTLRVRGDARDRATAFVRRHQFEVGAPLHFDEEYDRVSCLEYVLATIGGDLVNGMRRLAHRRRLQVDQIEAVVEGELNNPLTYLGVVGESGHTGLEKVSVSIYASTLEDKEQVRAAWDEVLEKSPLARTFQSSINLELSLKLIL